MKEQILPDCYQNFEHMSRHEREGVDFTIEYRDRGSSLLIMAPHGGRIEPPTCRLARLIAAEDFSFYGFRGTKAKDNWNLHLTSHRFDEPTAIHMVRRAEAVLTIHGSKGSEKSLSIGGLGTGRAAAVRTRLEGAGFCFTDSKPSTAGRHPSNICNRGTSGGGVQLELSFGLRADLQRNPARLRQFAEAVRSGLLL